MDLLDALSSQSRAQSVVELSLENCFRREHTSVFKAIASYAPNWMNKSLAQLASPRLPCPQHRPFWALGVDTTPQPRPYAQTLKDRGYVYQPALLQSNKPVTIGHCYSEVALLPELEVQQGSTWVVPLSCQRVSSAEDKELAGAIQMNVLLDDPALPFHNQLCVEVGDTSYSKPKYLFANRPKSNLVSLVRVRSTRTFHRKADPSSRKPARGHPAWYGAAFSLQNPHTWHTPDEIANTTTTSRRRRVYQVKIEAWQDMLIRGKRKPIYIPMHRYPFTLVRICLYNANGALAYPQALWVIVMGEKRRAGKCAGGVFADSKLGARKNLSIAGCRPKSRKDTRRGAPKGIACWGWRSKLSARRRIPFPKKMKPTWHSRDSCCSSTRPRKACKRPFNRWRNWACNSR